MSITTMPAVGSRACTRGHACNWQIDKIAQRYCNFQMARSLSMRRDQRGKQAMSKATVLSDKFDRALLYATHVHGGQVRKETSIPYVAHLLAVAATVLEYGGDEDLAIAGLLHDSVEDQGGKARLDDIRNRFGKRVARK